MYAKDDEDLSFLPRELSSGFEMIVVGSRSVAKRSKSKKCRTNGSTKPPLKRRLVQASSSSKDTRQNTSPSKAGSPFLTIYNDEEGLLDVLELQNSTSCHLKISNITPPSWRGHLDNQVDAELLDLHDRFYARQAAVDNAVNRRARELLKGEDAMEEFDDNPSINVLRQKIMSLSGEVKENKATKGEDAMEEFDDNPSVNVLRQKIMSLSESKVASLEAEKAKLEVTEALLCQEVETVKCDRVEVISKVVPYVAIELVHSDEMGKLVAKLVSFVVFYRRCVAFEEVMDMKEPFDLEKVKGYRPSYKKEHIQARNDLATATFPFLSEFAADPSSLIEALLSKKP
nr:hypothetical protein [Tanacetum cinerariifolium]